VRLVDGGTGFTSSGTVEVYLNNEWGTICADEIAVNEADTICRQLGYTNAVTHSSTPPTRYAHQPKVSYASAVRRLHVGAYLSETHGAEAWVITP
jgi:hypothetical protein